MDGIVFASSLLVIAAFVALMAVFGLAAWVLARLVHDRRMDQLRAQAVRKRLSTPPRRMP